MEQEHIEDIDSNNDEDSLETQVEKLTATNKSLYERTKKAEGFERGEDGKWTKKEVEVVEEKKTKTEGFGLDVKGFLKGSGIKSTEFDFVQKELKRSGDSDIESLIENPYFLDRLEKHRDEVKTKEATPTSKRSGGVATGSAEYFLTKPFKDVPSDMKREVLALKLKKDKKTEGFYNS